MIDLNADEHPVGYRASFASNLHVSDRSGNRVILTLGSETSTDFGVKASVMLEVNEVRLLRRRLKAALKGNPRPDEVM